LILRKHPKTRWLGHFLPANAARDGLHGGERQTVLLHGDLLVLDGLDKVLVGVLQLLPVPSELVLERLEPVGEEFAVVPSDEHPGESRPPDPVLFVQHVAGDVHPGEPPPGVGVPDRPDPVPGGREDLKRRVMIRRVDEDAVEQDAGDHVNRVEPAHQVEAVAVDLGVPIDRLDELNDCFVVLVVEYLFHVVADDRVVPLQRLDVRDVGFGGAQPLGRARELVRPEVVVGGALGVVADELGLRERERGEGLVHRERERDRVAPRDGGGGFGAHANQGAPAQHEWALHAQRLPVDPVGVARVRLQEAVQDALAIELVVQGRRDAVHEVEVDPAVANEAG
jgi:hypothetical protein